MTAPSTSVIAVVAARGGSKRLPRKNIRPLGGMPLIGWSLQAARAAGVSEVFLTTEDEEIESVGKDLGFAVPFRRPTELATDYIPAVHAVVHLLDALEKQPVPLRPELIVLLPPTAPFRPPALIRQAITQMARDGSIGRATAVKRLGVGASGLYETRNERAQPLTRPDDPRHVYAPSGGFFAARPAVLREHMSFRLDEGLVLEHTGASTLDIDTEEDFQLAEAMLSAGLVKSPA